MTSNIYGKLARTNVRKNYRFFIPRILMEAGLLAVYYIFLTLQMDKRILNIRGGDYISTFMAIGILVLVILSTILMFYINSFLMKQRTREYGLYNILGMEKKHVAKVMFHETLIGSVASLVLGIGLGILFYKLCSLIICRLLETDIILGMDYIQPIPIAISVGFFAGLDLITFVFNLIRIARLKPVDLLASSATGEKEPKVKWPLLVIGLVTLGGGYYISLTTQSPLKAILMFFLAVILVMIGTYFLFVAGSIFVLKCLKKNTRYYYSKRHMPAVAGLLYRMKQNAVGLASICILATGVLVMISTTVSLYSGMQQTLVQNYPQDYYVPLNYYLGEKEQIVEYPGDQVKEILYEKAQKYGLQISFMEEQKYLEVSYNYVDGELVTDRNSIQLDSDYGGLMVAYFMTEQMYRDLGGERLNLAEDEVAVTQFVSYGISLDQDFSLADMRFHVIRQLASYPIKARMTSSVSSFGIVVANDEILEQIYQNQVQAYGVNCSEYSHQLAVCFADLDIADEANFEFDNEVSAAIHALIDNPDGGHVGYRITDGVWEAREAVLGMYGAFLFLGIILGTIFLFATALIIYYKQISEGYEDRKRFQIMQKIGMDRAEVRKTINTQVLLVFFLPLITAGIHLVFAFPILEKLLHALLLSSTQLFIICSAITFVVFSVFYVLIYSVTAKTYYKIVK